MENFTICYQCDGSGYYLKPEINENLISMKSHFCEICNGTGELLDDSESENEKN